MKTLTISFVFILFSLSVAAQANIEEKTSARVEVSSKQKIKVFPNPATNVVNILGLINSDKADIQISDVYGNVVQRHQWRIKNNALNIPIVNLSSGIYIVTIISHEQKIQTKFYKK